MTRSQISLPGLNLKSTKIGPVGRPDKALGKDELKSGTEKWKKTSICAKSALNE